MRTRRRMGSRRIWISSMPHHPYRHPSHSQGQHQDWASPLLHQRSRGAHDPRCEQKTDPTPSELTRSKPTRSYHPHSTYLGFGARKELRNWDEQICIRTTSRTHRKTHLDLIEDTARESIARNRRCLGIDRMETKM